MYWPENFSFGHAHASLGWKKPGRKSRSYSSGQSSCVTLSLAYKIKAVLAALCHDRKKEKKSYQYTVLYLEASVLLEALPNSVNPKDPISVKTL